MKSLLFILLLFSTTSFASVTIPEKIIEISIYDLIDKKSKLPLNASSPQLPAGYGDAVARKILEKEKELTACIPKGNTTAISFAVSLSIVADGKAKTKFLDNKNNKCVEDILNAIAFPTHPLKNPVVVRLPLVLENTLL